MVVPLKEENSHGGARLSRKTDLQAVNDALTGCASPHRS